MSLRGSRPERSPSPCQNQLLHCLRVPHTANGPINEKTRRKESTHPLSDFVCTEVSCIRHPRHDLPANNNLSYKLSDPFSPSNAWAGPFVRAPESPYQDGGAESFARAAIFTICSAGVSAWEARRTYGRCMAALEAGFTARMGFRHPAKADAIDTIWRERERLHRGYDEADDRMAALSTPVTCHSQAARHTDARPVCCRAAAEAAWFTGSHPPAGPSCPWPRLGSVASTTFLPQQNFVRHWTQSTQTLEGRKLGQQVKGVKQSATSWWAHVENKFWKLTGLLERHRNPSLLLA